MEIGIGPRRIKQADWGCSAGRLAFCGTDTLGRTDSRSSKGGAVARVGQRRRGTFQWRAGACASVGGRPTRGSLFVAATIQ